MTAHDVIARIARQILRERYASIEDQADAMAAAIITEGKDAGYAVVELPEPNEHNEWGGTDWFVWISRGGSMQVREPGYMSHPIKARQFAAALLAAADAAEES